MKKRTNMDLPDTREVLELILERESNRIGRENTWIEEHPESFVAINSLCDLLGAERLFASDYKVRDIRGLDQLIQHAEQIKHQILRGLEIGKVDDLELLANVWASLAREDEPSIADALFVFGAPSNARIDKAVELYREGLSPLIIISGKGPNWAEGQTTSEAKQMADRALSLGVDIDNILIEEQALTIPDNVKRTVDLIEAQGIQLRKVIIIASSFVMLRAYIDWMRFPSTEIEILCVSPAIVDTAVEKHRWHDNEKGRNLIINEYVKILHEAATNSYLRNHN